MSEQIRRRHPERAADGPPGETPVEAKLPEGHVPSETTDELLDEIDQLIEETTGLENAQQFVAGYVQKGGQ